MNKFIKSLIATGLSVATVLPNTNMVSNAWDDECYDKYVNKLNENTRYVYKDKNVCGWNDEMIDVLTYDKIPDYIDRMKNIFDETINKKHYYKNFRKVAYIYERLNDLMQGINENHFKQGNILTVKGNLENGDLFFDTSGKIKYNKEYDEYFKNIKEKLNPILDEVNNKYFKYIEEPGDYNKLASYAMIIGTGLGLGLIIILPAVYLISLFSQNNVDNITAENIINKYKSLPEAMKIEIKKNFPAIDVLMKKKLN